MTTQQIFQPLACISHMIQCQGPCAIYNANQHGVNEAHCDSHRFPLISVP